MIKSVFALLFLVILYTWSATKLHLNVFIVDSLIFNFFILYVPTLVFFSSIFLETNDVFKEVQRLIVYSFVPAIAFRIGWYGYSFHYSFVVCYILSNFIKPRFSKRFPIIIFNGLMLIIFLIWRVV
ncbi:MAG: hypothetical protein ABDH59_02500 [Fervidobacterium sp.]